MTDAEVMRELGRRLKALRGNRSQSEAARLAGLTRQTVSRAELGDNPTLETLVRLLRTYGRLPALESFIPLPEVSPMALLRARRARPEGTDARDSLPG
jgi:transcriptional regulator with XRE-family HTH domain